MVVTLQLCQIDLIFEKLPVIEGILQFLQLSLTQGSSTARRDKDY